MEDIRTLNRRYVAAASAADGAYYRWAKHSNVTWHTLDLLYALDDGLPHSQKQICEDWLIPKTTINTVVKGCKEAGFITMQPMPDHPREQQLCLTEAGRAHAKETLEELYAAENTAMRETAARFGTSFVDAVECYCAAFRTAIENNLSKKEENNSV